ncbi:thioredoxin family protein [Candidatus Protochlamydia phocaeensis]|uniref:thioredoxin family protein n=1 Tax=Candidatus Protochlamydia phocaeensis TaxID=1414722 RepID=UPI000838544B|nr:thioredoxin family protein [Candidatus Protochlamydia phocaeensis]
MKKIAASLLGSSFLLIATSLLAQPYAQPGYGQQGYAQPGYAQPANSNVYGNSQINWLKNYQDAVSQSQATSKPIVILFTGTTWCPACMKLEREVLTRPEFAQAVGNRFIFLKAEFPDYAEEAVMSSPYYHLVERYKIEAFPTLVIINAGGQRLSTVNYQAGGPDVYARQLMQSLNSSSGGYYR